MDDIEAAGRTHICFWGFFVFRLSFCKPKINQTTSHDKDCDDEDDK